MKNNKKKFKFILMGTDEVYGDLSVKSTVGFSERSNTNPTILILRPKQLLII